MKPLNLIILLFLSAIAVAGPSKVQSLREKIGPLLEMNSEYKALDLDIDINLEKLEQTQLYLLPKVSLFHTTDMTSQTPRFESFQTGAAAQLNIFNFGKDYFRHSGQRFDFEIKSLDLKLKKIRIENSILKTLWDYSVAAKRLELYKDIANIKLKALKIAQQRYERGNLPQTQLDKVEIDYVNLTTQKQTLEQDYLEKKLNSAKLGPDMGTLEWPLTEDSGFAEPINRAIELPEIKKIIWQSERALNEYRSTQSAYFPSLEASARSYDWRRPGEKSNEWDISLSLTWVLWDGHIRSLNKKEAYRDLIYWKNETSRAESYQNELLTVKKSQLSLQKSLVQKLQLSLKKLTRFYSVSDLAFSQGRITVNELFLDQQLLLETQINYENEIAKLHYLALDYCEQRGLRFWDCIQ